MDLSVPGQAIVVYSPITNEWMGPVGGTDWNYHTASNWNGYVPGASGSTDLQKQAVFGSIGTAGAVNVNGAITLGSLIFDNATAPYNLSGSTITIQSDTTAAAQITVLASPVVGHSVANNLTLNSNTDIRITQGLTISGSIGGAHAPVLYGDNLVFSGNNTYSGETVNHMVNFMLASPTGHAIPGNLDMSGAWMFMGAANQFGSTSVVNFKSGEWFLAGYNQTVAGISSENGIGVIENSHETAAPGSVVGDSVLTVNTAADCAFSGIIRDHGGATPPGYTLGLTKSGTATLTLSGPLTYTGPTTLEDGVLKIDATNVLAGDIVRGASTSGTLEVGGAATELTASGLVDIGEAVIGAGNTLTLLPTGSSTDLTIDVVSGEGTLQVLGTATLTAQSIVVDTLVIGNAGGAASAAVSAVPEPSAMLLLAIAGSLIAWFRLRKNG
jgi:autotransporter-associated beta strand protein